jgi:hypothetical protein
MNMDYSLSQALSFNMSGIPTALILYDIMCQYSVHLSDRMAWNKYLGIPDNMSLKKGIGLFHIHGHQDSCYPQFSPTYIQGVGQVDGEILETLWAPLNQVSGSTRSMTTAHWQEILDDHMNDSNWKKQVNAGRLVATLFGYYKLIEFQAKSLCAKYNWARANTVESQQAFDDISTIAEPFGLAEWITAAIDATRRRDEDLSAMDIYDVQVQRGDIVDLPPQPRF